MNKFYIVALLSLIVSTTYGQTSTDLIKLRSELEVIYTDDQKGRRELSNYNSSSQESRDLWKTINKSDSANLNKVRNILDKYGWLSVEQIGREGNSALFLVIQHSDLPTQMKYQPMMEEAVKAGKASGGSFALLTDRILIGTSKKQRYGSQIGQNNKTGIKYVLPLEDPENVDIRRGSVGLSPMKEYLEHFKMTWSIIQYESDLAANTPKNPIILKPVFKPFKQTHLRDTI